MTDLKILAVDDDLVIQKMLEIALKSNGYQVVIACNGSEAIAALQQEKFDLVITDLQMGDPDGFAVLRKAKELNPLTRGGVITGNQDLASAIKAIKIGIEDYLLKPFSLTELLDSVKKSSDKLTLFRKAALKETESNWLNEQLQAMMLVSSHDVSRCQLGSSCDKTQVIYSAQKSLWRDTAGKSATRSSGFLGKHNPSINLLRE